MRLRCFPAVALSAAPVFAAALAVTGCGASTLPAGPLGPSGNPSTQCNPGSLGHALTVGLITVTNSSSDTLTVDAIGLAQSHGIKLVGADITPGQGEAGNWATFPPPAAQVAPYLDWAKHVAAAGAHIRPSATISITLGIEPTRTGMSSASDVEVLYHDGGTHYDRKTNLALKIAVAPAKCSDLVQG
jgi:hypothetical protein